MKPGQYDNIYFIGIGGIGMSALARWFKDIGKNVSGYDRTATPLTSKLVSDGMAVHFNDSKDHIPRYILRDREKTLVVFTPAIPSDHEEFNYLKENGFTIMKRSEVLSAIAREYKTVAVGGTHGKTTTTSMIAHILKVAGFNMTAFLGGVSVNYDSNLVVEGSPDRKMIVVVEADEFDRSFLRLFPDIAVITSADPDHLDIYGDSETMVEAYRNFVRQIRPNGVLIVNDTIAHLFDDVASNVTVYRYGVNRGLFFASSITPTDRGFFEFDLIGFGMVDRVKLGIPGFHNVENAVAASVAANCCGVSTATIKGALESFRGVKRRFEFIVKKDQVVFIDDYAHHPAEIEAFLKSLRAMYPNRKLTVVFQPHLYSRTRDFASGFAESLSLADELLLMDIYPAREKPIPGVDSDLILSGVKGPVKIRCGKEDMLHKLERLDVEVLATVGAGDIDTFIEPIKEMLSKKYAA